MVVFGGAQHRSESVSSRRFQLSNQSLITTLSCPCPPLTPLSTEKSAEMIVLTCDAFVQPSQEEVANSQHCQIVSCCRSEVEKHPEFATLQVSSILVLLLAAWLSDCEAFVLVEDPVWGLRSVDDGTAVVGTRIPAPFPKIMLAGWSVLVSAALRLSHCTTSACKYPLIRNECTGEIHFHLRKWLRHDVSGSSPTHLVNIPVFVRLPHGCIIS